MDWMIPSVVATLAGTVVLALLFVYLYYQDREFFLKIWAASWIIYALRMAIELAALIIGRSAWTSLAGQLAALHSGVLLLWGSAIFVERPLPKGWPLTALALSLWIAFASFAGVSFQTLSLPTFFLLGAIFIWTGIKFIQTHKVEGLGKHLTGWAFIIWGIHKMDYPFLKTNLSLAPWGYLLASVLEFFVAFGILLIYFQLTRTALHSRISYFKAIFDSAAVGIGLIDVNGHCIQANQNLAQMLGYRIEELLQMSYREIIHPEEHANLQEQIGKIAKGTTTTYQVDRRFIRKDGSVMWGNVSVSPIQAPSGRVDAFVVMLTDITRRNQDQAALKRKNYQQSLLFEIARHLTESLDLHQVLYQIASGSRELLDALGCIIYFLQADGRTLTPVVAVEPDYEDAVMEAKLDIDHSLTGMGVKLKCSLIFNEIKPGGPGAQIPGTPIIQNERVIVAPFIVDNQVVGAMCLNRIGTIFTEDERTLAETFAAYASLALKNAQAHHSLQLEVEERKRVEWALRESEASYRSLFEDSPVSLWEEDFSGIKSRLDQLCHEGISDFSAYFCDHPEEVASFILQARVTAVNRATIELYKAHSKEELLGDLGKITDGASREAQRELVLAVARGETRFSFETTNRTLDGDPIHISLNWSVAPGFEETYARVMVSIVDITQRKQRERELKAIVTVARNLRSAQTLDEILPAILDEVKELLQPDGTALGLRDPRSGDTIFKLATGIAAGMTGERLPTGTGVSGHIIQTGQPYLNNAAVGDQKVILRGWDSYPKALAGIPLIANQQTIGVLLMGRATSFSDEDIRLLNGIAEIAANAIQREGLHEQSVQHAADMSAVSAIGHSLAETLDLSQIYTRLAKAVQTLLPDIATLIISQFDPEKEMITAVYGIQDGEFVDIASLPPMRLAPPGMGAQSEVLRTRQPLIQDDLENHLHKKVAAGSTQALTQSALYVPLLAKGEILGVFQVQSYTRGRFSQKDAELLTIVGNTAAIAIQNARLYEEAQRRIRRMNALHRIDEAITGSFDLNLTLQVVLSQITTQLEMDSAAILQVEPVTHTLSFTGGTGFRSNPGMGLSIGPPWRKDGFPWRVILEQHPILISDLSTLSKHDPFILPAPAKFQKPRSDLGDFFVQEGVQAYFGVPLIAKGQVLGVLELYHHSTFEPDAEWLAFLDTLARQTAIAIDNDNLFEGLQRSNLDLTLAYDTTLEGWAKALELRDKETQGHSQRVIDLTLQIAQTMGISGEELLHLRRGTMLHDIGKMGIPDSILLKSGPLTPEEWEIMRQHPGFAYDLLSSIPFLRPALDIPYCHHEKWDGSGYPRGLKGEQIPLGARIFAVADVWDALLSDRPYRPAWPEEKVRAYLREQSGIHFDPQVVEVFFQLIDQASSAAQLGISVFDTEIMPPSL